MPFPVLHGVGPDMKLSGTMQVSSGSEMSWAQVLILGRKPGRTFVRVVVIVILSFVVFRFVLLPIQVKGPSMLPTYNSGVNFVNRLAYFHGEPQRGDVVAVRTSGLSIMFMKRIIGLPGETIVFLNGQVYINGLPLQEPYLKLPSSWTIPPEKVRPGHYYCVGDNRSMPHLDHEKGQAERGRIVGKVLL